jgi:flagellar assembly protein FliH
MARPVVSQTSTPGQAAEPSADAMAQMNALRQQCEQRIAEARLAGVREAEAAAKAQAAAEVKAVMDKMTQSIAELGQFRGKLRRQAEGDTIKLALAIAKRVMRREISVDADAMRGLVIAALEKLQAQEIYRVRVSSGQAAAVTAALQQAAGHVKIEVIADSALAPGGIIFETSQGNLDASVDSQLNEIERGLADHLRKKS